MGIPPPPLGEHIDWCIRVKSVHKAARVSYVVGISKRMEIQTKQQTTNVLLLLFVHDKICCFFSKRDSSDINSLSNEKRNGWELSLSLRLIFRQENLIKSLEHC